MVKNQPIISVIIACYNEEDYISDAIKSVLNQTLDSFELIVVDDSSTDKTVNIAQEYVKRDKRVKIIRLKNREGTKSAGPPRNKGISKAEGKYIAILDADDIALYNRLEIQKNFLDNNPDYGVVGSNAIVCDADLNYLRTTDREESFEEIKRRFLFGGAFIHSSVCFRKRLFQKVGGYKDIFGWEDDEFLLRLCSVSKGKNIQTPLIIDRLHSRQAYQGVGDLKTKFKLAKNALELIDYSLQEIVRAIGERLTYKKIRNILNWMK